MTEEELLLQKKRLELEKEMAEADEDIAPQQIAPARMPQPETPVSSPEAMARGLSDVLTFGTAKYVAPAIRGGLHAVLPKKASEFLSLDPYDVEKERYAEREKIAKEYEPGSYLGGQALGIGSQILAAPFTGAVQGARLGIPAATRALAGQAFESFPGQAALGGLQAGTESQLIRSKFLKAWALAVVCNSLASGELRRHNRHLNQRPTVAQQRQRVRIFSNHPDALPECQADDKHTAKMFLNKASSRLEKRFLKLQRQQKRKNLSKVKLSVKYIKSSMNLQAAKFPMVSWKT